MVEDFLLPDIGDYQKVDVVEVLVKEGQTVKSGDNVISLETDKATMEIPINKDGIIKSLDVKVGTKVSKGDKILSLETSSASKEEEQPKAPSKEEPKQEVKED